jgi:hypothetical protein
MDEKKGLPGTQADAVHKNSQAQQFDDIGDFHLRPGSADGQTHKQNGGHAQAVAAEFEGCRERSRKQRLKTGKKGLLQCCRCVAWWVCCGFCPQTYSKSAKVV